VSETRELEIWWPGRTVRYKRERRGASYLREKGDGDTKEEDEYEDAVMAGAPAPAAAMVVAERSGGGWVRGG
jgi:hypothetical protein